jgi:nitrilase
VRLAAAQLAPVFLDRRATAERIAATIEQAAAAGVHVLAFGETYWPGYPLWPSATWGARFDDPSQKAAYRHYLEQAVDADGPELRDLTALALARGVYTVIGFAERGRGSGSGSIYAAIATIVPGRGLAPIHRKLVPTYEERLVWAPGDGHGLRVHPLVVEGQEVRVGALNCWENWMPQARHAMYAQGEQIHVAIWPGSVRLTADITRFVALEGRVFVLSAGGLLRTSDVPADFVLHAALPPDTTFQDGGSAIAAPDGRFIVEPQAGREGLIVAEVDLAEVAEARQNFDPTGHYARPDVFDVRVDRRRRAAVHFAADPARPDEDP